MDEVKIEDIVKGVEQKLHDNLEKYHEILKEEIGKKIYTTYKTDPQTAAKLFLQVINLPIKVFREILGDKKLNYGSASGIIREWLFYYIIDAAITEKHLEDKIKVFNNYSLPYKWKSNKRMHKEVNIDIVVGEIQKREPTKLRKLFYCMEIKTNFNDGFERYYEQQSMLYHQRTKVYPKFLYYYVYFYSPPSSNPKMDKKVKLLKKRQELWCFPPNTIDDTEINNSKEFLDRIYEPFKK